jgi:hypothetical protein
MRGLGGARDLGGGARSRGSSEQADARGDQADHKQGVDDQEVDSDVALAAAQPALLHPELVQPVEEPRDAGANGDSAMGTPSQPEQNDADRRWEDRVLDEDRHGTQEPIHVA